MFIPEELRGTLPYKRPVYYQLIHSARCNCGRVRCASYFYTEFAVGPAMNVTHWLGVN